MRLLGLDLVVEIDPRHFYSSVVSQWRPWECCQPSINADKNLGTQISISLLSLSESLLKNVEKIKTAKSEKCRFCKKDSNYVRKNGKLVAA